MNELDAILGMRRAEPERTGDAVLATVVHVRGSAYRRPGARMMILSDGTRIGTVSGGCLERDVSRKAWWLTASGRPVVRAYDTSSDEDAVWEFGLGCNGIVHVLFERLDRRETGEMLDFIDTNRSAGRGVGVATVIAAAEDCPARVGERLLVDPAGARRGALAGSRLECEILGRASDYFRRRENCLVHLPGCSVFAEWIGPPLPLIVFGAGHDAVPVARFARELGWHVTVADGRPAYATRSRFPEAGEVVLLDREDPLGGIRITRDSAVVLMTHNYPMDVKLLERILPLRPRYLGLLGPRSRSARLLEEVGPPPHGVDVHAPVGLDLGSQTPESIALSIVGEIEAFLHRRPGSRLKLREGPIHANPREVGLPPESLAAPLENAVCELR